MAKDATTAAAAKPEAKERKKPVRKAPVQKDYPNKLAWLKAMTEYEEEQSAASNEAKVVRLDKRIASIKAQTYELATKLELLQKERAELVPADAGMTEDEHLAAEGKA